MKAIVRDTYGSPDVLELRDIDRPEIEDDEVLVGVHAAGVGRDVWHVMTGLPYPIRLAGYGLRAPKNPVIGSDMAGVVEAVGKNVTRFQPGEKVFVIGASGGVGTYAVQLARAFGAEVTGVCSTAKVGMVRSIGADHVIDYTHEDFAEGEPRYDLILDIGGNSSLARLRRALTPKGTLVIVGGEADGRWLGGTDRQLRAMMLSPFVGQKLGTFINKENHEDMIVLAQLIESTKVTPVIDRTYPLSEVPEAIRYLEEGHAQGKVVITV